MAIFRGSTLEGGPKTETRWKRPAEQRTHAQHPGFNSGTSNERRGERRTVLNERQAFRTLAMGRVLVMVRYDFRGPMVVACRWPCRPRVWLVQRRRRSTRGEAGEAGEA